jgi:hypothetical protein
MSIPLWVCQNDTQKRLITPSPPKSHIAVFFVFKMTILVWEDIKNQ